MHRIHFADNLELLRELAAESVDLIYIDPPFNTGRVRRHTRLRTIRDSGGDRTGFKGERYRSVAVGSHSFADLYDDYLAFLEPRLVEAWRTLAPTGSMYLHLDYREAHYCKVLADALFGRDRFLNEIIWAYDYGGRSRRHWPPKHDTILMYVKDPARAWFDIDAADRIPYMAPGLVGPEKAARGKTPTDTWWHTIVPTNGRERTGYPTQKPLGILERIVAVSSPPDGLVLDFFAGSGTTGEACLRRGRRFVLVDNNPEAMDVMAARFRRAEGIEWVGWPDGPGASMGQDAVMWTRPSAGRHASPGQ